VLVYDGVFGGIIASLDSSELKMILSDLNHQNTGEAHNLNRLFYYSYFSKDIY